MRSISSAFDEPILDKLNIDKRAIATFVSFRFDVLLPGLAHRLKT